MVNGTNDSASRDGEVLVPSEDALVAPLEGETVLLNVRTKRYYRLNETGARIWTLMQEGRGRAQVLEDLCARYDVTHTVASTELDRLIADLRDHELLG